MFYDNLPAELFNNFKEILTPSLILSDSEIAALVLAVKKQAAKEKQTEVAKNLNGSFWEAHFCLTCAILAENASNYVLALQLLAFCPLKKLGSCGNKYANFGETTTALLQKIISEIIIDKGLLKR